MKIIKMITFDLDGTIIDDEWAHEQAKTEIAASLGVYGDLELSYYTGRSNRLFWDSVCKRATKSADIEQLVTQQFQRVLALLRQAKQPEAPGLTKTLQYLKQEGIIVAVTSGSDSSFVEGLLEYLHITKYIDVKVTKDHVRFVKPDPDIYLAAQRMAGIDARYALGVEDSLPGCQALRKAGMVSAGFTNQGKNPQCLETADFRVAEMTELIPLLQQLRNG